MAVTQSRDREIQPGEDFTMDVLMLVDRLSGDINGLVQRILEVKGEADTAWIAFGYDCHDRDLILIPGIFDGDNHVKVDFAPTGGNMHLVHVPYGSEHEFALEICETLRSDLHLDETYPWQKLISGDTTLEDLVRYYRFYEDMPKALDFVRDQASRAGLSKEFDLLLEEESIHIGYGEI